MLPVTFVGTWLALWACVRLLFALPWLSNCGEAVEIDREWWRVTLRLSGGSAGLAGGLGARRRSWLRRWFSAGAGTGLLIGACSVLLLLTELRTLLRLYLVPAALQDSGGERTAAASAVQAGPRLQLALPGVTLPASHALPLWLALAASLAVHEMGHALAAAAEGVLVTSAGLSLLLLVPAAFVELDSADLAALSRHSMLRVAAAGAWHNAVLGLACWGISAGAGAALTMPVPAGGSSGGTSWEMAALGALLSFLRLLLGYTASLSVALALLNMAPVWFLDGQQALEALVLRPSKLLLPELREAQDAKGGSGRGGSNTVEGGVEGGRRRAAAATAVQWALHAGTALYAAVVMLHLAQMR